MHYGSPTNFAHLGNSIFGRQVCCLEVNVQDPIPEVNWRVDDCFTATVDASAGEQHIKAPELPHDAADHALAVRLNCNVSDDAESPSPHRTDLMARLLTAFGVDVRDGDRGTLLGQTQRRGTTEA